MKLLLVAAPIIVVALFVAARALRGRALTRSTVSVLVALLLLIYLVGTAGLGLFWVSQMDLPRFDLHYLLGYCLILVAIVHMALQLRVLGTFFRKHSPPALLSEDRSRFRPGVKRAASAVLVVVAVVPMVWLLGLEGVVPEKVVYTPTPSSSSRSSQSKEGVQVWIEHGGSRQTAIEYMYEQSSHTRARLFLRAPRLFIGREPAPLKIYRGETRLQLPEPRRRAGVTLHEALQRVARGAEGQTATVPAGEPALSAGPAKTDSSGARIVVESKEAPAAISREQLAQLLYYANGVTSRHAVASGILLRAAPSAGALYPTDIYVAARKVDGVEPGIYYYHPHEHTLVPVGGQEALGKLTENVSRPDVVGQAPVSFLFGATFDRTAAKYKSRAYRYVTLDTGHVAANLGLTAAALGIRCEYEPLFGDVALTQAVDASLDDEGMLLVMPCGSSEAERPNASAGLLTVPQHSPPELPDDPDAQELTRLSHRLTSWRLLQGAPREVPVPKQPPIAADSTVALAAPAEAELDLFEVISRRRSFREYAPRSVAQDKFAGMLRDALALAPQVRGQRLIELYVFVGGVDGLEPGTYRYLPESHALERIGRGDQSRAIQSAGLSQEALGRAAFVLLWAMRTELLEQTDGARGFRHAHLDAGFAGENAYLSAVARGLGICGVGAFYDDAVNELIDGENRGHLALYLMAVGHRS